jgi:hypothetical protein
MKNIFLSLSLILLSFMIAVAQSEVEKKIRQQIWDSSPAEFKLTEVPGKWKNESAIVMALSQEYVVDFTTKVTGLASVSRFYIEKYTLHYRIKLIDKAAVKDYSELSFDNTRVKRNLFGKANAYRVVGIKVIKPNGTEKEVDFTEAVKSDAGSAKELKIPIPNLETGDIIDYFIALRDESTEMPDFGDEQVIEGKYPILRQIISFMLPHQLNFYSTSYYGAPGFKKEVIDKDVRYVLTDEMREKAPDLPWTYEYRTAPQFRYRITSEVSKPDLKVSAATLLSRYERSVADIGFMVDFMSGNFKKESDRKKIANEIYYLLRNPIYMEAYFRIEQGNPLAYHYTPDQFFVLVSQYFKKYKIDHDIIIVPSRKYGTIDEMVNFSACDIMIRVNTQPAIYIPRPSPFTIPNEVPYFFEGVDGIGTKEKAIKSSTVDENITHTAIQVSADPSDIGKLNLKRSILARGHCKAYHQYMAATNYDYLKEYDLPKYQVQSSNLLRGLIKNYNSGKGKLEQRQAQDYNERDNRMKEELEKEMNVKVSEYKNLTVKSLGMWHTSPDVEYSDEFTIENISKKAGQNYIFELGRLIEKQTEIKEDQRTRTRDVFMDYPRSFTHEITLAIPDGYTVDGVEKFNKKTENEFGGFISTCKLDGKTLTIKTRKYYTNTQYKATDWPKIVGYLDTAVELYNEKILLKKK